MDFESVNQLSREYSRARERKGTSMMSDITMLIISVAINIAIVMLAMVLRNT